MTSGIITVHEDSMSPDNWHVVFRAYVHRGDKPFANGTADFIADLEAQGRHHTFDSNGRLWFETLEDAMLYYMRFS